MSQTMRRLTQGVPVDWDGSPLLEVRPRDAGLVFYTTSFLGSLSTRDVQGNAIVIPPFHVPVYAIFKSTFESSLPDPSSDGNEFYFLMGWGPEQENANDTTGVRWVAVTPRLVFSNFIGYRAANSAVADTNVLTHWGVPTRVFEFVLPRIPSLPNDLYYFRLAFSSSSSTTHRNAQLWVFCKEVSG